MSIQQQTIDPPEGGGQSADQPGQQGAPPPAGLREIAPPPGAQHSGSPYRQPGAIDPPKPRPLASGLPGETLAARLDRERRKILRDLDIDDPAKFKAQREAERAELARLKEQEEAGKRAQMSELQRVQADLDAERKAREAAEAKARDLEEVAIAHEQEAAVRGAALRHVDPEMYDYARTDFQRHIRELERRDPKKLAAMSEDDIEKFFKDLVKKKPRLAPLPAAEQTAEAKKPAASARPGTPPPAAARPAPRASTLARRPAAGSPPLRQPPAPPAKPANPGGSNGKTVKPGLPNSMSSEELKAHLRQQGRRPWG